MAFQPPNFVKPRIPPPPALPRFGGANDPNATGEIDVSDSAQTTERRAMSPQAARKIVRRRTPQPAPILKADGTEEVAVQDILLEAYLEDPPPPSTSPPPPPVAIPYEAPRPSQGRAVDALLRNSDPGVPSLPEIASVGPLSSSFPATSYALPPPSSAYVPVVPADYESPSVAPVAFGSYSSAFGPLTPPAPHVRPPPKRAGANVFGIFAFVLVVFAISAGTGAFLAMPNGTAAAWTSKAKDLVSKKNAPSTVAAPAPSPSPTTAPAPSPTTAPVAAPAVAAASAPASASAPAAASASAPVSASAPASAPVSASASAPASDPKTPTVSIDALQPKGGIHPKTTLVVFPETSRGHRIWVDGTMVTAGEKPTMLKCGHRKIQIGSAGKTRKIELPCGKQIVLDGE